VGVSILTANQAGKQWGIRYKQVAKGYCSFAG